MNSVMSEPGARRWRHLGVSLLILFVLVGVVWLSLARPALHSRQVFDRRVAEMQSQYQRFTVMSARTGRLRETVAALERNKSPGRGFLAEKSAPLAAADLQSHLKNLINDAGGALISTQVLPSGEQDDIFPGVGIRVHARADMEALQQLLYRLAVGRPVLLLDNVLVRQRRGGAGRQGGGRLEVLFDVTGFIYRPRPS